METMNLKQNFVNFVVKNWFICLNQTIGKKKKIKDIKPDTRIQVFYKKLLSTESCKFDSEDYRDILILPILRG